MTDAKHHTSALQRLSDLLAQTWPGLVLCGIVAFAATLVNEHVPLLSPMLLAILVGLVLRNVGAIRPITEPGLKLTGKTILRAGVVLLGLRLSLPAIASLGWGAIVVIVATVAAVFGVTLWLGPRLGVPHAATLLTATGTAICGAAAVAGMSAVTRPDVRDGADEEGRPTESVDDAAATAIASVTLFGTLAILVLPVLVRWMGLETTPAGVWVGVSVHEVGQVVATGGLISPEVLDVAVVAKLGRVALLAPLIAIVGAVEGRRAARARDARLAADEAAAVLAGEHPTHPTRTAPIVPLFVVGFLAAVILRSVSEGFVPTTWFEWANAVASFLLTMAMCAMGAGVNLRRLVRSGGRSLLLGLVAALVAALVSLAGVTLLV